MKDRHNMSWEASEDARLRELFHQGLDDLAIASHFPKRGVRATRRRRIELKLKSGRNSKRPRWLEAEDSLLKTMISDGNTAEEICVAFPSRTLDALSTRAFSLGLQFPAEKNFVSDKQWNEAVRLAGTMPQAEIAEKTRISQAQLSTFLKGRGLSKAQRTFYQGRKRPVITPFIRKGETNMTDIGDKVETFDIGQKVDTTYVFSKLEVSFGHSQGDFVRMRCLLYTSPSPRDS